MLKWCGSSKVNLNNEANCQKSSICQSWNTDNENLSQKSIILKQWRCCLWLFLKLYAYRHEEYKRSRFQSDRNTLPNIRILKRCYFRKWYELWWRDRVARWKTCKWPDQQNSFWLNNEKNRSHITSFNEYIV
jgi:hypothetical protein